MHQSWESLTFIHWRYPPDVLRARLPPSLQLDTFQGDAFVSMTPFLLTIPVLRPFPEMNVRTYVIGPDGDRGIWFFTLEAARLTAVLGAWVAFGLPYRWAKMTVQPAGPQMRYGSDRRWGPGHVRIRVRTGHAIQPDELAAFLTARFSLYSVRFGRLITVKVEHPPWPLRSATLLDIEQNVLEHSGLPPPDGVPFAHFSPGVSVRVASARTL